MLRLISWRTGYNPARCHPARHARSQPFLQLPLPLVRPSSRPASAVSSMRCVSEKIIMIFSQIAMSTTPCQLQSPMATGVLTTNTVPKPPHWGGGAPKPPHLASPAIIDDDERATPGVGPEAFILSKVSVAQLHAPLLVVVLLLFSHHTKLSKISVRTLNLNTHVRFFGVVVRTETFVGQTLPPTWCLGVANRNNLPSAQAVTGLGWEQARGAFIILTVSPQATLRVWECERNHTVDAVLRAGKGSLCAAMMTTCPLHARARCRFGKPVLELAFTLQ